MSPVMAQDKAPGVVVNLTPNEAILHSAEFLKKTISVRGTIAFLDLKLQRMDVAKDGGKLVIRLTELQDGVGLSEGQGVTVIGILRKEQRRTFLEATEIIR